MAVFRNAEDDLPAYVVCTQGGGPSVLLLPHGCSVQVSTVPTPSQHYSCNSCWCTPAQLCPSVFHSRLMLPKAGGHVDQALQSIPPPAVHVQEVHWLPGVSRLGEYTLHAQEMLPITPSRRQSCCCRELPVPKRPGLHVESSDFMWTQFLVSFYQFSSSWPLKT